MDGRMWCVRCKCRECPLAVSSLNLREDQVVWSQLEQVEGKRMLGEDHQEDSLPPLVTLPKLLRIPWGGSFQEKNQRQPMGLIMRKAVL